MLVEGQFQEIRVFGDYAGTSQATFPAFGLQDRGWLIQSIDSRHSRSESSLAVGFRQHP
jgi:hypothetical protein